jgi:hypothetical protein
MAHSYSCICSQPVLKDGQCESCGKPFLCDFVLTFAQEEELVEAIAQTLKDISSEGQRQILRRHRGRKRPTKVQVNPPPSA